jgi:ATP-dependent RNA helicase DeaD
MATTELAERLEARGYACAALNGDLNQSQREKTIEQLKSGHLDVVIATDVAARGLDLPDLGLVIHAELPTDSAALLHRSGRTGRAGRKGVCVLVVPHPRRRRAEALLASAGVDAEWTSAPSAAAILARDHERLLSDPMLTARPSEEETAMARALLAEIPAEQVAAALLRLHNARLPTPASVAEVAAEAPRPRTERKPGDKGAMVTFSISVGRRANADPKWLLPVICRRGNVTTAEIGAIRIFDRESTVEIAEGVAEAFLAAANAAEDDPIRFTPAGAAPRHRPGPAPHRKGAKFAPRKFAGKKAARG